MGGAPLDTKAQLLRCAATNPLPTQMGNRAATREGRANAQNKALVIMGSKFPRSKRTAVPVAKETAWGVTGLIPVGAPCPRSLISTPAIDVPVAANWTQPGAFAKLIVSMPTESPAGQ